MDTAILSDLCSIPTAPFAESNVVEYVKAFVAARPKLKLSCDSFGNLLIELAAKTGSPRWVFTAHMDHPGFVADRMLNARTLRAFFRGYVLAPYFRGARVRFFDHGREITGRVTAISTIGSDRADVPASATIQVTEHISPGSPGMWDQGESRIRSGKFQSRVCDDLAGGAACLTMLDELCRKSAPSPIAVLLTRAEEEGFIGAVAAALQPKLIRKSDRLVAIECSAAQPQAPLGGGAVIRVGDRSSIFNSDLTGFITAQATALAKKDKKFRFRRALMPGGTCEATVYDIYGFIAASICVPLGNYHNMDTAKKKIAPEFIDLDDWRNMTRLFVHLARSAHKYEPGHRMLKKRIETRFAKLRPLLDADA